MKKIDHDVRRQEIAQTAARLIAEQGIDKLTIRLIAKGMDCSTGVLSHYFKNKDEIVLAALNWANEWVVDNLLSDYVTPESLGDLQSLLTNIMPLNEEADLRWRVRISSWAYALSHPDLTAKQLERTTNWQKFVIDILAKLQAKGKIKQSLVPEEAASALVNLVIGTSQSMLFLPMESRGACLGSINVFFESLKEEH